MRNQFSLRERCFYYGMKIFVYSVLILLFNHHSIQTFGKSNEVIVYVI